MLDADADLDVDHNVSRQRMLGWLDALGNAGIKPQRRPRSRRAVRTTRYAAALLLLAQDDPPTALLCFSDVMANGVVRAAEARGLRVPDDLSVVGFDDSPLAGRMRPALTTVRQPVEEKGHAAAAALTALIERTKVGRGQGSRPAPACCRPSSWSGTAQRRRALDRPDPTPSNAAGTAQTNPAPGNLPGASGVS